MDSGNPQEKGVPMSTFPPEREVEYPSSDGKPFAETDRHRDEMFYLIEGLRCHFRDAPDVYVSGNILLYYMEGNPRFSIAPDVLIVRGPARAKELRDNYLLWAEGKAPCWIMEVTSKKTRWEDLTKKKRLYRKLGVEEYFLFDPRAEYLDPPLQGFRITKNGYRPSSPEPDGWLSSSALGLAFRVGDQGRLRILDPKTGTVLLRPEELEPARLAALEEARLAREWARLAQERLQLVKEAVQATREQTPATEERMAWLEEEIARLRQELESRQG
jgi:Uma2 family endonuclease